MANNRLYIECTGCDEADLFYMGKRMRDGYYGGSVEPWDWFDKHKHCGGTADHFRLVYECPENYDVGTGLEGLLVGKLNSPLFK